MLFFQNHQWKFRYDPRTKDQASSTKPQAPIFRKLQAASSEGSSEELRSLKHQALQVPSGKLQAQNNKRQASSRK
jgi:hypothetical protein